MTTKTTLFRLPIALRPRIVGRRREKRRGAALVEMAVVLPLFVSLALGMIELGRALMMSQLLTNAAREGARLATLTGTTNADVQNSITTFLQSTASVSPSDVSIAVTVSDTNAGNNVANAKTRDLITVQVGVPFSIVSYLPPTYLQGATLTGYSAMRHE